MNEIHGQIKKSNKKLLMDKIARRLLELEFKSDNSIKTRCLKYIAKKILLTL